MSAKALAVNPTRQELLKVKTRYKTAKRGHALLKDKRDGLMRAFMEIIHSVRTMRAEIEADLRDVFYSYSVAQSIGRPDLISAKIAVPDRIARVEAKTANIMSVRVPKFSISVSGDAVNYGFVGTPAVLDTAVTRLADALPKLIRLAEMEHGARLMAREIEKTRRRVNALEHTLIPSLELTVRGITSKLDERERGTVLVLMKVKDMISAE